MEGKYTKYFAYGSNMSLRALEKMGVRYRNVQAALLQDYILVFNVPDELEKEFAFASVLPCKNNTLKGLVMEVEEESVKILDDYEAFPHDYLKEIVCVETLQGEKTDCFMYVGNPAITKENLKPWPQHLKIIEEVYSEYF